MMKKYVIILLLFVVKLDVFAQIPYAGLYNQELYLGVNEKSSEIRGFYYNQSDDGKIGCTFLLYGKYKTIDDTLIQVIAYYPLSGDTTYGEIICPSKKLFKLKLKHNPMGCSKLVNFEKTYTMFLLTSQAKWKAVRVVKSNNAAIHIQPNANSLKVSRLINGDYVYILEQKNNWLKVEFNRLETQIGWVLIDNFY